MVKSFEEFNEAELKYGVINVYWFSGKDTVGIVKVREQHTNAIKYYIGVASSLNQQVDIEHIASWGARFPNQLGDLL